MKLIKKPMEMSMRNQLKIQKKQVIYLRSNKNLMKLNNIILKVCK